MSLVEELKNLVNNLRIVKCGDQILDSDHNDLVNCWQKQKEINQDFESKINNILNRLSALEQKFENAILPLKVLEIDGSEFTEWYGELYVIKDISANPITIETNSIFVIQASLKLNVRAELGTRPSLVMDSLSLDLYLDDGVNYVEFLGHVTPRILHDECIIYLENTTIVKSQEKASSQTLYYTIDLGERVFLPEKYVDAVLPFDATELALYISINSWGFNASYNLESAEGKLAVMKIEW